MAVGFSYHYKSKLMQCRMMIGWMVAVMICPASSFAQSVSKDKRTARFSVTRSSKKTALQQSLSVDTIAPFTTGGVVSVHASASAIQQKAETITDSALQDRLGLQSEQLRTTGILNGNAAMERQLDVPNGIGYRTEGAATLGNIVFTGVREREEHPQMLTVQRLDLSGTYQTGSLSLTTGVNVNRYFALGITTQYGIHGALTYSFSPNFSLTAFGVYENRNPWFYMAAFPDVDTSRYGGYLTYRNGGFGTHVGAERYYDPFVRQWEFRPIVTPFIQVSKKFIIELPLGGLLKEGAERLLHVNHRNGPMIMPSR